MAVASGDTEERVKGLDDDEWVAPLQQKFGVLRHFNDIERYMEQRRRERLAIAEDRYRRGLMTPKQFKAEIQEAAEEIADAETRTPGEPSRARPSAGCLSMAAARARAIRVHFCASEEDTRDLYCGRQLPILLARMVLTGCAWNI